MRRLGLVLVALLALAGCGGSAAGIGQTAAGQLVPQVEQVRAAAVSGDRAAAAAKLAEVRASVADLRQRNQLSEAAAAKVLAAAAEVEAQLGAVTPAPQPTTIVPPPAPGATSATRPPPAPAPGDGNKGKGNGKGKD